MCSGFDKKQHSDHVAVTACAAAVPRMFRELCVFREYTESCVCSGKVPGTSRGGKGDSYGAVECEGGQWKCLQQEGGDEDWEALEMR